MNLILIMLDILILVLFAVCFWKLHNAISFFEIDVDLIKRKIENANEDIISLKKELYGIDKSIKDNFDENITSVKNELYNIDKTIKDNFDEEKQQIIDEYEEKLKDLMEFTEAQLNRVGIKV